MKIMFPPQDGKCCGYLRRSQQDAEYERYGKFAILERHERLILELAEDYGHTIQKFYREVVSGETIAARDEFRKLLREIALGEWDVIYVVEASRLGRGSGADQDKIINAFKCSNTWLITEGKVYNPRDKADMRMLRKELQKAYDERDDSVERLTRGRRRAAAEGCYMPARPPYGWAIDWQGKKRTLKPHPVNYDRLMSIYDMLEDGMSLNQIALKFEEYGYETSHGARRWCGSAIKQIASNDVNIGYITWDETSTEESADPDTLDPVKFRVRHSEPRVKAEGLHKHHCTIDEDRFERVRRIVEARSPYSTVHGKPLRNHLAGLLRCAKCGSVMKWNMCKTMDPPTAIYTHGELAKKHLGCNCKSVHADVIMDALVEVLGIMMQGRELEITDDGRAAKRERHMNALKACEKDLEQANAEKSRVMEGYRKGVYTADEFVEEKRIANERIEAVEIRLSELRSTVPDDSAAEREIVTIERCLEILRWDASPKDVNDALKQFIKRIDYENFAPPKKQWHDIRLTVELR